MARNLTATQYAEKLEQLKFICADFEEVQSRSSKYILYKGARYYYRDSLDIPLNEMHIFKKVEADALLFLENNRELCRTAPDVRYICTNDAPRGKVAEMFDGCIEIDISQAYTAAALKLGVISKETFAQLQECSKPTKLAALGSLASVKTRLIYTQGKHVQTTTPESKPTRNIFFIVAKEIEKILTPLLEKYEDIFFCWVDAIFCPAILSAAICRDIKAAGYQYKVIRDLRIYRTYQTAADGSNVLKYEVVNFEKRDQYGAPQNRPFLFSVNNYRTAFNYMQAKEKELFEYMRSTPIEDLKRDFSKKLVLILGESNTAKINRIKIIERFNSVGLDYSDFLKFEKRVFLEIEKHQIRTDGVINSAVYSLGYDYVEALKEYKDAKEERVAAGDEINGDVITEYFARQEIHISGEGYKKRGIYEPPAAPLKKENDPNYCPF